MKKHKIIGIISIIAFSIISILANYLNASFAIGVSIIGIGVSIIVYIDPNDTHN